MTGEKTNPPVPRWRRRDYFSKKWFQLRIIAYYVLILLGGAAGLSYYIYGYAYRTIRLEMFKGHSMTASPWEILRKGIFMADGITAAAVILVAILTTFFITRSVSRAAGRLADNLRTSLAGGHSQDWAPPLGIYEFQHLHRLLDEALQTHHVRTEELAMLSRILQERVREVHREMESDGLPATSFKLRALHVQCEKLKNAYNSFMLKCP